MSGPAVAFDSVTKRFADQVALAEVSLTIPSGSFLALVGASGSGKSTLLKTVNRMVAPDAGRVLIAGEDAAALDPVALRRRTGYVFQHIGLFPHMNVASNIGLVPRLAGTEPADVAELLALVGLPASHASRMPSQLSGGEQQRVGVARALAARPRLMLMDEPFGALDPVTRDELGRAYRALHDRLGLTTIMVTHDMAEALILADRIAVMSRGRIVADATPHGLLTGQAGAEAAALIDVPRRHAEQLRRIAAE